MNRSVDEYGFPIPESFDAPPAKRVKERRPHLLLVPTFLLILATIIGGAIKYGPSNLIDKAKQAMEQMQRRHSLAQIESDVRRNPNNPQVYLRRGAFHLRRADYAKAIGDFERVLKDYPDDMAVKQALALALNNHAYEMALAREDLPKALQMVQRALELSPPNAAYLDTRGYLYYLLGRYEEALPDLERAVELAEDDLRSAMPGRTRYIARESLAEIEEHRELLYKKIGTHHTPGRRTSAERIR